MNKLLNSFLIKLRARKVGRDEFGNVYYEDKRPSGMFARKRRHVIYSGCVEGSKVPAHWYCWLHYQTNAVQSHIEHYAWEVPHEPNRSGTSGAYYPKGHVLSNCNRGKAYGDYEPWEGA